MKVLGSSKLLTFGLFPIQCCRAEKERVHRHKKSDANLGKLIKKEEVIRSLRGGDDNEAEIADNYLEEDTVLAVTRE